jgi:hypothetical protein
MKTYFLAFYYEKWFLWVMCWTPRANSYKCTYSTLKLYHLIMLAVLQRHSRQVCDGAVKLATTSSILTVATLSLIVTLLFDVHYNLWNFGIRPLHGNNAPSSAARLNITRLTYSCGECYPFYCGSSNIRDLCVNNSYHVPQQFYFFILYVLQFKQATS